MREQQVRTHSRGGSSTAFSRFQNNVPKTGTPSTINKKVETPATVNRTTTADSQTVKNPRYRLKDFQNTQQRTLMFGQQRRTSTSMSSSRADKSINGRLMQRNASQTSSSGFGLRNNMNSSKKEILIENQGANNGQRPST